MRTKFKGFTLIEILVAMFIFVLLMGMVFVLFKQSFRAQDQARIAREVQQNARFALDRVVTEMRCAAVPLEYTDLAIISPSLTTPTSTNDLIFTRPAIAQPCFRHGPAGHGLFSLASRGNRAHDKWVPGATPGEESTPDPTDLGDERNFMTIHYTVEQNRILVRKVYDYRRMKRISSEPVVEVPVGEGNRIELKAELKQDPATSKYDPSNIKISIDLTQNDGKKPQRIHLESWVSLRIVSHGTGAVESSPGP